MCALLQENLILLYANNKDADQPVHLCHLISAFVHYANTPMYYTAIFHGCKNDNFQMKNREVFFYICSKHGLWVHVRTA